MKILSLSLILSLLAGCGDMLPGPEQAVLTFASKAQRQNLEAAPHTYMVMFKTQTPALSLRFATFLSEYQHHYSWLQEHYLDDPRVAQIDYITTIDMSLGEEQLVDFESPRAMQLQWHGNQGGLGSLTEVRFRNEEDARRTLTDWHTQGSIWYAEPNYYNSLQQNIFSDLKSEYESAGIWWHQMIKLYEAYETISSRESGPSDNAIVPPVIAVLDSGLDIEHRLLADRVWVNGSPGSSGCAGDVNGCNTTSGAKGVLGTGDIRPFGYDGSCANKGAECIHGTHVSGIIASRLEAAGEDSVGGVCPVCKIMTIRIIKDVGGGVGKAPDAAILRGMKYMTLFKSKNAAAVRVLNNSYGKYNRSRSVALLVASLKKKPHEVVVVGSAGNEDSMRRVYPAALSDALAVASLSDGYRKSSFSNFGPWVDIAAPGGEKGGTAIVSTAPGDIVFPSQGTSMAAPVVSGVLGLVLAMNPTISHSGLRNRIVQDADGESLYSRELGGGFNYAYYYPQVGGESVRRPLLGSGILDANGAISGTGSGKLYGTLKRVDSGCSVTGGHPDRGVWGALSILLLPLLLVAIRVS